MSLPRLKKEYQESLSGKLRDKFAYKNVMQIPRVEKLVINLGFGGASDLKQTEEEVVKVLGQITGQRPTMTKAKKSIAGFKLRKGMVIGAKVTLRDQMMYDFLLRFIHVAAPTIRDFRGVSNRGFDGRGNYNIGVKDITIFPEIELDKVSKNYGLEITFVTSAQNDTEAKALLEGFGMPFAKKG